MQYVTFIDYAGQWRWQLQASNKRIIANSGEGYFKESDCLAAINLVKHSFNTPVIQR